MKTFFLPLVIGLAFAGGVRAQNDTAVPTNAHEALAAAAELLKVFQGGTNNPLSALGGKPVVDFRELKALLPEQLAGLPRSGVSGEKTGAFGANVSQAEGKYGAADGPRFTLKITDLGAMGALGAMAGFGWAAAEIDRESDTGFERTVDYQGHKVLEKYSTADQSGTANVVVGGRFHVELEGTGIDGAQLKAAAAAIDYGALDRLGKRPEVP